HARKLRYIRPRGDDDVLCFKRTAHYRHLARCHDTAFALHPFDLVLLEEELDTLGVAVNRFILEGEELLQIELRLRDINAHARKACSRFVEKLGRMEHRLGRDATDIEAGAAQRVAFLDNGHAEAKLGRLDRALIAARACTDHHKVESIRHDITSKVEQQTLRVFQNILHAHKEGHGLLAIDDAVIIGEREIHHRADFDLAANDDRAFLDLVHTENARLRRIQDRRGHERTIDTTIGDGEGTALQILKLQGTVACAPTKIVDRLLDACERQVLRIAHHRHNKPAIRTDRNADIVIILVDEVVAINFRVDGGDFAQRMDARRYEETHEADAHTMLLLEEVLVLRAQRHDIRHVHLVEGGEHGSGVLRILEARCDGLAQARHPHTLFKIGRAS